MTFRYDKETRSAIDEECEMSIRPSRRFLDDSTFFPYQFTCKGKTFDFEAAQLREERSWSRQGQLIRELLDVATYINEPSVRRALGSEITDPITKKIDQNRYLKMREIIKDGMTVYMSRGGEYLKLIPDFHVDYISTVAELDKKRKKA